MRTLARSVCVRMCVCVFVLCTLLFPSRGGRMRTKLIYTDWMSVLPSDIMEEIIANTDDLHANT